MGEEIDLTLFCNSEPNEYLFKQLERSDINALFKFLH